MIDSLQDLLKTLGIPGVITTIILLIAKNNPITSMSSSWLEIKMATKEKRFYIRSIKFIFETLLYLIFFIFIAEAFFKYERLYNPHLAIIATILVASVFFYVLVYSIQEKNFFDLFQDRLKKWELFLLYIFFFTIGFLGIFILPAYFLGTQVYSEFYIENSEVEEKLGALIAFLVIATIYIVSIYPSITLTYYKFLTFKKNTRKYLVVEQNKEYWYIHHPIKGELYLLGDKELIQECTRFKFIEKNDLNKEVLLVK